MIDDGHITIRGIVATGRHGVLASERAHPQPFVVDLDLHLPIDTTSDDLARTVNYAEVATRVTAIIEGEPVNLIETLAGRIADDCLTRHDLLDEVTVTVHKPHAPVGVVVDDVAVTIRRRR